MYKTLCAAFIWLSWDARSCPYFVFILREKINPRPFDALHLSSSYSQWSRQRENFRNFSYNYVIAEVLVGALFGREDTLSLPVHGAGVEARNIALE